METRDLVELMLKNYLQSLENTFGITWDYEILNSSLPTLNDVDLTAKVIKSISKAIGQENVIDYGPVMGGEDFSEYTYKVPSTFFFVGGGDKDHIHPHHSSKFDIDENALPLGTAAFVQAVVDLSNN